MTGLYELGGRIIRITSVYEKVHDMCRDYRLDAGEEDFRVETCQADILFEREKNRKESEYEGQPVTEYDAPYLETLAVYRKIAERMPRYDTLLFHGSCVAVDGCGYLFTAPSGTGKSTHTRLWRQLLGERAVMVNDDKPLLHIGSDTVMVFGTPWDGKHHLSRRMEVPLRGLCILERAATNQIEPVAPRDALLPLMQQIYRPADVAAMSKTMTLLEQLTEAVPLYRLGCLPDLAAARLAYEVMGEEKK